MLPCIHPGNRIPAASNHRIIYPHTPIHTPTPHSPTSKTQRLHTSPPFFPIPATAGVFPPEAVLLFTGVALDLAELGELRLADVAEEDLLALVLGSAVVVFRVEVEMDGARRMALPSATAVVSG